VLLLLSLSAPLPASAQDGPATLPEILRRAGDRVEQFFTRAQSLVCQEVVRLQPLAFGLSADGFGRTVESELRVAWDPGTGDGGAVEARTMRAVVKVNGQQPRRNDRNNCTTPEQQDTETQPLSMLLPTQRGDYTWTLATPAHTDGRAALRIDYRMKSKVQVEVHEVEGKPDCISFDIKGGMHGRVWIDAETYDVLRLDQSLDGPVDIPLPKTVVRRSSGPGRWTADRMDTSIRFKRVSFADPEETLTLPVSSSTLQIVHGAGTPRLRTSTTYTNYKRFMTGGRIVP
jgi:hypothetical protein